MSFAEGRQLALEPGLVAERDCFSVRFEEKVERIDHRHFGDQVDIDGEIPNEIREDHASEEITLRVLLPIQEVRLGLNLERVSRDRSAAMGRRAQANGLGRQSDQAVILVSSPMMQSDADGHSCSKTGGQRCL